MSAQSMQVESPRLLWVSALTIAVSIGAVSVVREVAVRLLHPSPGFGPLTPIPPIMDTIIATVVAILVFAKIAFYPNPVRTWRRVSAVVLVVSLIPDVLLATSHSMGAGWPEACALMVMHVAVWAICVTLLPKLAFTPAPTEVAETPRPLSIL